MKYVGHSDKFHDAGIAAVDEDGNIPFAYHAERYNKKKYANTISEELWDSCVDKDDHITYYADPYLKYAMMESRAKNHFKGDKLNFKQWKVSHAPNAIVKDDYVLHHVSHAATAYYTRPWESSEDTVIMTIDGMGEYQTSCIFDHNMNLIDEWIAPKSIGDFYSVATRLLNFRTMEEEYIVMGLAAYGEPTVYDEIMDLWHRTKTIDDISTQKARTKIDTMDGLRRYYAMQDIFNSTTKENFAASIQKFAETTIVDRAKEARKYGSKLCYGGGVAQNIVANSLVKELFDDMWIPPAPNDGGSPLGAAAYSYSKKTGKNRINFTDPYLGYNIDRPIDPVEVVDYILENKVAGVANGRAEWGPRALGNRSLLGDVRFDIQDTVNRIKKRELFRPFAPAVLEEYADEYFEGAMNEYMQYNSRAKDITKEKFPSIVHVDGTSRVQVVRKDCKSALRQILEEYHRRTGVPILLNTSLNIKGQPILNDEKDCELWEEKYGVKIFGWR